jgi:hypothetical protein
LTPVFKNMLKEVNISSQKFILVSNLTIYICTDPFF